MAHYLTINDALRAALEELVAENDGNISDYPYSSDAAITAYQLATCINGDEVAPSNSLADNLYQCFHTSSD